MSVVVVAEKPSVARDVARVLGATRQADGCLEGNGYKVTWAIGHLVGLAEPAEVEPAWKRWDFKCLPMVPGKWPLKVLPKTRGQFATVKKLLRAPDTERVICATDAGREGELIFRFIYEAAGCRRPVQRLWISSLTDGAIREGFRKLKDARHYDALADAARARSQADWLVGMNLSRAYGLSLGQMGISVGRVQTPTLALLVTRELEIRDFKPEDYLEVVATFEGEGGARYRGTYFKPRVEVAKARRLSADGREAEAIVMRARRGKAQVETVRAETKRMPPPLLYDLTELQRHANRLYGMSAQRTLSAAQALYEQHKLLSYPRTDSRHLSQEVAQTLPGVVAAIRGPYGSAVPKQAGMKPLGRRHVDDAKVTDHHAIIPTDKVANPERLSQDERRLYDLVCRRLLAAWHGDHVWEVTSVVTVIAVPEATEPDRYGSRGTAVREPGWKALDVQLSRKKEAADEEDGTQALPPGLQPGQQQKVVDARAVKKTTRPPPRFTEASLLTAMETAGAQLDDKELSEAMKERGLGTPATRAATIETLLDRGYITREGKALVATDKGVGLVAAVEPTVKSAAMTGGWEARLKKVERGAEPYAAFMADIERYVREVVGRVPPPSGPQRREGVGAGSWRTGPGASSGAGKPRTRGGRTAGSKRQRPAATAPTSPGAAETKSWRSPPPQPAAGRRRGTGAPQAHAAVSQARRSAGSMGSAGPSTDPGLEQRIFEALEARDGQSTGRLCKALLGDAPADRRRFEVLLDGLAAAGRIRLAQDVFEVDGKQITYRRAWRGSSQARA